MTRTPTFADQILASQDDVDGVTRLYELLHLDGCKVRTDSEIEAAYADIESVCRARVEHWELCAETPFVTCNAVRTIAARARAAFVARFPG